MHSVREGGTKAAETKQEICRMFNGDSLIKTQLHLKPTPSHYLSNFIRKEQTTIQNAVDSEPLAREDRSSEQQERIGSTALVRIGLRF